MNNQSAPLIMLIGLPGSGKSTWAEQFVYGQPNHEQPNHEQPDYKQPDYKQPSHRQPDCKHPNYKLIATDKIRYQLYGDEAVQGEWLQIWHVVMAQLKAARAAIAADILTGVIYDATNARRRHRREFIQAASTCGYDAIHALWFNPPLDVCLARNQARARQVPIEVIEKMHRQLTAAPPTVAEGLTSIKIM